MRFRRCFPVLSTAVWCIQMAAAEEPVPLVELPPLVLKSLRTYFDGAKLLSANKDERNDYIHYFVKITDAAGERTIEILENGVLVTAAPRPPSSK